MAPATTDFWQILLASEWTLSHPIREAKQNACMSLSKFCEDPLKPLPFGVMKHTQLRNPHQRGRCLMAKSSKPCRTNFWNYQQTMFDYQRVRWFLVVFFIFTRSLVLYGFVLFLLRVRWVIFVLFLSYFSILDIIISAISAPGHRTHLVPTINFQSLGILNMPQGHSLGVNPSWLNKVKHDKCCWSIVVNSVSIPD